MRSHPPLSRSFVINSAVLALILTSQPLSAADKRARLEINDFDGVCAKLVTDIEAVGGKPRLFNSRLNYRTETYTRCDVNGRSSEKVRFGFTPPAETHYPSTRDLYIRSATESCLSLGGRLNRLPDSKDPVSGKDALRFYCDAGDHYPFMMSFHMWGNPYTGVAANHYRVIIEEALSVEAAHQSEYEALQVQRGLETVRERADRIDANHRHEMLMATIDASREKRREEERSKLRIVGLRVCTDAYLRNTHYILYGKIDQVGPPGSSQVSVGIEGTLGLLKPEGFQPSSVWISLDKLRPCSGK